MHASYHGLKSSWVILLIGLNLSISSFAQAQKPIDKIKTYVQTGDTNRLSLALKKIDTEFVKYNNSENKYLLLHVEKRAQSENYSGLDQIYSLIRQYYISEGNRPKTLEYSLKQYKAVSLKGDSEALLWILINIGNMFYDESEFDQALSFYQKAENIALKTQEIHALSVIYLNYGLVHNEKKNFQTALKHLQKSSHYRIREQNVRMASSTFVRIADTHMELQQADSAKKYILLAEEYYYRKAGSSNDLTEIPMYIDMAWFEYYMLTKNHVKALAHFEKAQEYALKYNMMYDYYSNIFYEASYYSKRGEYKTAIEKLNSTLPFIRKNHLLNEERYVYKMVGGLYVKLKDSENANRYLQRYIAIDDSIKQSSQKTELDMLRTIAAVYESDASLQYTKRKLQVEKINAQTRAKERNASIWIAALAVFGILILLGLFLNLRRNKKTLFSLNRKLQDQHLKMTINALELERTNKIKDKLFSIIAHDLRNPLNRLMAELSIAKKRHAENHFLDPMEITLKETINLFEGLLHWSKMDNNHNIYSPSKVNLSENINQIISFYLPEIKAKNISVVNNSHSTTAFVDRNILQTLFRNILGNAIASIAKANNKGMIEIQTTLLENDTISILFHDSGGGFPAEIIEGFNSSENITSGKGLGLSICKMLAKMSGWTMQISNDSKLGGALILLELPVFKDEASLDEVTIPPLSETWKTKLGPVKNFKFYQTSEIRKFLKSLGEVQDYPASLWVRKLEECVLEGDNVHFAELLKKLEDT